MRRYVIIRVQEALNYWKDMNPNVELTEERLNHIREHHPSEFDQCVDYIDAVIEAPDLILDDHKNPLTAMFIRRFDEIGINIVIKLALNSRAEDRSFIVTIHPVGERSIQKLAKKNKIVYKKTNAVL